MDKREIKGLGDSGFTRHYQPQKNYYSNARMSVLEVRKKSLRVTFLTVFAILVIFYIISWLTNKEMDEQQPAYFSSQKSHSSLITPNFKSEFFSQVVHIELQLEVQDLESLTALLPIEVEFGWQNSQTVFARYLLDDSTLWNAESKTAVITLSQPAAKGAQLFSRFKTNMDEQFLTLVRTVQ